LERAAKTLLINGGIGAFIHEGKQITGNKDFNNGT
jgi:hypothetical protein